MYKVERERERKRGREREEEMNVTIQMKKKPFSVLIAVDPVCAYIFPFVKQTLFF